MWHRNRHRITFQHFPVFTLILVLVLVFQTHADRAPPNVYACRTSKVNGGAGGTFGLGITQDGFNWKALPAPKMLPEAIGAELGAVEYVQTSNPTTAAASAVDATSTGAAGGLYVAMLGYGWPRTMLAYTSPSPLGPFTRAAKNVNFLNGT